MISVAHIKIVHERTPFLHSFGMFFRILLTASKGVYSLDEDPKSASFLPLLFIETDNELIT